MELEEYEILKIDYILSNNNVLVEKEKSICTGTEIYLLSPQEIKTGALEIDGDYAGLFLSRDYIENFPLKFKINARKDVNVFEMLQRRMHIANDIHSSQDLLKEFSKPDFYVDYGFAEEKQIISKYIFTNKDTRIENGYVSFGRTDGIFIRGDSLMALSFENVFKTDIMKKELERLQVWREQAFR